jgi:hypothetical protein
MEDGGGGVMLARSMCLSICLCFVLFCFADGRALFHCSVGSLAVKVDRSGPWQPTWQDDSKSHHELQATFEEVG